MFLLNSIGMVFLVGISASTSIISGTIRKDFIDSTNLSYGKSALVHTVKMGHCIMWMVRYITKKIRFRWKTDVGELVQRSERANPLTTI